MKSILSGAILFFGIVGSLHASTPVIPPLPHPPFATKAAVTNLDEMSTKQIADSYKQLDDFKHMWEDSRRDFSHLERGDKIKFYGRTSLMKSDSIIEMTYTFIDSCEGAYVFSQPGWSGHFPAQTVLQKFPQIFTGMKKLFGKPEYDIDGNEKILILLYEFEGAIGFAEPHDILPIWGNSNGMESIHINPVAVLKDSSGTSRLLAHELQHVFAMDADIYEDSWLWEGQAEYTADLITGNIYNDVPRRNKLLFTREWISWSEFYNSARCFVRYVCQVGEGEKTLQNLCLNRLNGSESVENVLHARWSDILSYYGAYRPPHPPIFAQEQTYIKAPVDTSTESASLLQNSPNPFNPETTIRFETAESGMVELTVYSTLGQQVRILQSGYLSAGQHLVQWDSRDTAGRMVASGVYIYRLTTKNQTLTRHMLLVK